MEGYLMSLISVALLGGIVGMIAPEGEMKPYVRLLSLLCLLCAMIAPILSLWLDSELSLENMLGEIGENETINYDEIYKQSLLAGGERQAEEYLYSSLVKEFDLPPDALEVFVKIQPKNDNEYSVEVTVALGTEAIFADPHRIIEWVENHMDCRCTVFYE